MTMPRRRTQEPAHPIYPTHKLMLWDPETKARTQIGSGWEKEGGRIGFKANPGIQINWLDVVPFGKLHLVVWPVDEDTNGEDRPF